jgi:hypothetical protein
VASHLYIGGTAEGLRKAMAYFTPVGNRSKIVII